MKNRILSLILAINIVLTATSSIYSLAYADSNLSMSEIEALVLNYFYTNSGLDGNFVIFDNETTNINGAYQFVVRYQGNSQANTLHAIATVKISTGEMFVDDEYIYNIWTSPIAPIKVICSGQELFFDQPPIMTDGNRVLVPIRVIFEALGYSVDWYGDTQTAVAKKGNNTITVRINNPEILYSRGIYLCDVPPQIVSERTLVPVRAISECAGCSVDWNGETKTVIVTSNER